MPYNQLHSAVQRWIYQQGWPDLRDVQKQAISPILAADTDLIISAATAAGKTEAAFIPACSAIAEQNNGFGVLCLSPLKALINDQFHRLESLFDSIGQPLTPWHGDSSAAKKKQAKRQPAGGLLITPEALEAMFMLRASSGWMNAAFTGLHCIIIDEYHTFIGTERGHHLQSLLHRLEHLLQRQHRPIPRIALSATLGDLIQAKLYLRPAQDFACKVLEGTENNAEIKIQQRGYINPARVQISKTSEAEQTTSLPTDSITTHLYQQLRGQTHLVFANSRSKTEQYALGLSKQCEQAGVPNEFFPHHGSLDKHYRAELEARLQQGNLPTTAVCTTTLEMGIDVGKVTSVAQINPAPSVASLRQRLGRSGRRNAAAILRVYIEEDQSADSFDPANDLRLQNLQSLAMLHLLIAEKWYEPPEMQQTHFSTLIHQILATIAQWGAVQPQQLWQLLCKTGPFNRVTPDQFKTLLRHLGARQWITQPASGELILDVKGEKLTSHYTFYPAFHAPEEYRLVHVGKNLGTLPLVMASRPEQCLVFAGKRWKVTEINEQKKVIYVVPAHSGEPAFAGGGYGGVHDKVRQTMYDYYCRGDHHLSAPDGTRLNLLNKTAGQLFQEGLRCFRDLRLQQRALIRIGKSVYLIPWMGDKLVQTLTALLEHGGYTASHRDGVIEVQQTSSEQKDIVDFLQVLLKDMAPTGIQLAQKIPAERKQAEKYDHLLPEELLDIGYAAKQFDVPQALRWLAEHQSRWLIP